MKRSGWLAVTLLPVLTIAGLVWLGLDRLERFNRKHLDQALTVALDSTAEALSWWAKKRQEEALSLAKIPGLLPLVRDQLGLPPSPEALAGSGSLAGLRRFLGPKLIEHGFLDFHLIGPQGFTLAALSDRSLGQEHPLAQETPALDRVFQGRTGLAASLPGETAPPGGPDQAGPGRPVMFVLAPVRDQTGPVLAVLAFSLDLGQAFSRITLSGRFGLSGETYAYDRSGRIISPTRFVDRPPETDQGPPLSLRLKAPGPGSTEGPPLGPVVQPGRAGKNLKGYPDYRGVQVVGTWRWIEEMGVGLATEMDLEEAYAAYRATRWIMLLLLGGTVVVFTVLVVFLIRSRKRSLLLAQEASSANRELFRTVTDLGQTQKELTAAASFPVQYPYPILRLDDRGTIVYANQGSRCVLAAWGRELKETAPQEWVALAKETLASGAAKEVELRAGDRDYSILLAPVPEMGHVNLYGIDISVRKEAERQLRLAGTVFETTHDGIIITDPEGRIAAVNPAFSEITGYRPQEVIGQTFHLLSGERNEPELLSRIWSSLREKGQWQGETWNRRKNGEAYPEWHTINVVKNETGDLVHLVTLFSDITQIKQSQEEIRRQAHHDALTGLPNRLLFNDRLEMSLRQARRRSEMLAIIFLDLDHFKEINDSLGHDFGDLLLQAVAQRLKDSLREEDTVARLGGDEFIILLRNVKAAGDAEEVAVKINTSLAEPLLINDRRLKITSSLGLAFHPHHGQEAEELIKNADVAMYQAKNMGRNNFQVFSPDLDARTSKRLIIKTNLQRALDQEEFEIHYQPLVALKDGSVVGVEALLRWPGGDKHQVQPVEFIQVAEETGLILPLSEWAFEKMVSQVIAWEKRGLGGIFLAANLSLTQLLDRTRLIEAARRVLKDKDLDPGRIRLEISEKIYTSRFERIKPALEDLQALGLKVSLDHFGIGGSALPFLHKASLSSLKMDKSLIRDLGRSPEALGLVKSVIAMSHSLGLEVVAEGVESRTQLQALAEIQCDQAQGFLISQPLPPEKVEVFVGRLSF